MTTDERGAALARRFEEHRGRLEAVALRMLGSRTEAEDAVQETWLRISGADTGEVENLGGWLTTVTARICLDQLRARRSRERQAGPAPALDRPASAHDAETELATAEAVGLALLVVLEKLEPAERIAFVLHDLFAVPFEDVAHVVERSPEAARQLASRARRRVRGAPDPDVGALARQRRTVEALLTALRAGDVEAVVAVLDPDVVVDAEAPTGKRNVLRGARTWARPAVGFGRMLGASVAPALVDGAVGAVYAPGGRLERVLRCTFAPDGRIATVEIIGDPRRLERLVISVLG